MLTRYALIDAAGNVINAVDYETPPLNLDDGVIAIAHAYASPGWRYRDGQLIPPPDNREPDARDVNRERDSRMSAFMFGGHAYDFDDRSQINIAGAFSLAMAAVMAGADPGDLRWSDPDYDFAWVSRDNIPVPMDAHEVVAFGKAAANWKSAHIFRARSLKDQRPIPRDYTSDAYWPKGT